MLEENIPYNIEVKTNLKTFDDIECIVLKNNIETSANMTLNGNIVFTLKTKNKINLNPLFEQLKGVPIRRVTVTLNFKEINITVNLLLLSCDEKITADYLTINGEII